MLPILFIYKHIMNGGNLLKKLFLTYILIIIIISLLIPSGKNNYLSIHTIDVGQGDSILIQTPNSKNILIDGGDDNSHNIVSSYLKKQNVKRIDNINLTVLAPSYIQEENNLNSIVFRIDYKNKSFLFTGDAEASNEMSIINSYELNDIDFLKVGHHGSSSSTTSEFIEEVSPDVAVISCGYKNQYGHPHRSTLDTLEKNNVLTYRTDILGHVVFYSDGDTIFTTKDYKLNKK